MRAKLILMRNLICFKMMFISIFTSMSMGVFELASYNQDTLNRSNWLTSKKHKANSEFTKNEDSQIEIIEKDARYLSIDKISRTASTIDMFDACYKYTIEACSRKISENMIHSNIEYDEIQLLDQTPPRARITVHSNTIKNIINSISFGLLFRNRVEITIQGFDTGSTTGNSGIFDIAYYQSDFVIDNPNDTISEWTFLQGDTPTIKTDSLSNHLYVRLSDRAGNVSIYEDGVVVFTQIMNPVEYVTYERMGPALNIPIDYEGNPIRAVRVGEQELIEGVDYHNHNDSITLTKTYLESLAVKDYEVLIYHRSLSVYDKHHTIHESIPSMTFTLGVRRIAQELRFEDFERTYTYGDDPFVVDVKGLKGMGYLEYALYENEGVASLSDNNITILKPGTFKLSATVGSDSYYEGDSVETLITVEKAAITVTADNKTKRLGENDPELNVIVQPSLVGNDTLNGSLTYDGVDLGTYELFEAEVFSHPYYDITFESGTMTIGPTLEMEVWLEAFDCVERDYEGHSYANEVVRLASDYHALSSLEKSQISSDTLDKLNDTLIKAGTENHTHHGVHVQGLPWHIRLVSEKIEPSDHRYHSFSDQLIDASLIALYDLKLLNTLTGEPYILKKDETVTLIFNDLAFSTQSTIRIHHSLNNDAVSPISSTRTVDELSCETGLMSMFGIAVDVDEDTEFIQDLTTHQQTDSPKSLDVLGKSTAWLIPGSIVLLLVYFLGNKFKH